MRIHGFFCGAAAALLLPSCAQLGLGEKSYPTYEPTPVAIERPAPEPIVITPMKTAPPIEARADATAPKQPTQAELEARQKDMRATLLSQQLREKDPAKKPTLEAYRALLAKAIGELRSGNSAQAEATLLEAHRLERDDALLYLYLSEATLKNGRPQQAAQVARRGLLVARTVKVKTALWKMVYLSAKSAGDAALMKQALDNVRMLQQAAK